MTVTPRDRRPVVVALVVFAVLAVAVAGGGFVLFGSPSAPHTPAPSPSATLVAVVTPPPATVTPAPTDTPVPTPTVAPIPSTLPAIVNGALNQRDPGGVWRVRYVYPQISVGTSPFAAQINADIAGDAAIAADTFSAGAGAVPSQSGRANTLTGSYAVSLLTPRLLSFRLVQVEDDNGARPATTVNTSTYDLATGQRMGLADIFADVPGALAIIAEKAGPALKAKLADAYDASVVADGIRPSQDNFAAWTLTKNGLEVTFQEYQVAPGALGTPVIVVAWSDLKAVVDPEGPAAGLAGA